MHHGLLGLSACASAPSSPTEAPPIPAREGAEPSGRGERAPDAALSPSARDEWCGVVIEARRVVEPTPSFLRAWNLLTEHAHERAYFSDAPVHTEYDARIQTCGASRCELTDPKLVLASADGEATLGVLVPTPRGMLAEAVPGGLGHCTLAPELRVTRIGELTHLSVTASDGAYARYYFHGELDEAYGGYPSLGDCEPTLTSRTDLIIDTDTGELLRLTQSDTPGAVFTEVRLDADGVTLAGCGDVLKLSWTS